MSSELEFDSLLLVSFGGPEGPDDVMPFLENVLRGKPVPPERKLEVADHYMHLGGVSPINEQNRNLLQAIRSKLPEYGIDLPIYWGNRNWHPLLADTLRTMRNDGRKRSLAFFTSIFSSYSGCRQYRENIAEARKEVMEEKQGLPPEIEKVRNGFNHPLFIEAQVQLLQTALAESKQPESLVLFSAHSIPMSMSEHCHYQQQLHEAAGLIAQQCGVSGWEVVYQSRSGPPTQPWLEPDICDRIRALASSGQTKRCVVVPLGFVSDHMEVLYDLDTEAKSVCQDLDIEFSRVQTVGTNEFFVRMICELISERVLGTARRFVGQGPALPDRCPDDCCLYPRLSR
ncbi:MAG: ferrochelatase [Planctomycetales bacterium]|nr:ferrochelatase [Planctomycetales bacterium]